jgi:hypothetical protein
VAPGRSANPVRTRAPVDRISASPPSKGARAGALRHNGVHRWKRVCGGADVARPNQTAPERLVLLPIPTGDHADLSAVLLAIAPDRTPRIDVLVGPDDAGKSALLRHMIHGYRRHGGTVRLVDLSIHEWRTLLAEPSVDVAFVDHLDRIPDSTLLQTAFMIVDRVLPAMFSAGLSRLVLALGTEWRAQFRSTYGISPESVLRNATPGVYFSSHILRPYTQEEMVALCPPIGLDPHDFEEPTLRRPGVVAMASNLARDHLRMTGACLRDLLAQRWIQAANDTPSRHARRAIWEVMGATTLRDDSFLLNDQDLCSALTDFEYDTLRAQEGGPLRWEGDQVQWDSPTWGDVAAARALRTAIERRSAEAIRRPLRTTVLRALLDISDRHELTTHVDRALSALRGRDFAERGYLGPVMGTLRAQLSTDVALAFQELSLQGPDQTELRPVDPDIAATVEGALLRSMSAATDDLIARLAVVASHIPSGYRGGYKCWALARGWASSLPLRASAEDAVLSRLPTDGSWRYEDILDVSVTGATTRLMQRHAGRLDVALRHLPAATPEYLADIWDGINDGAWDQIDSRSSGFVASLYLPTDIGKPLTAVDCRMQRAHFGLQDARGWRLNHCDLFLADFRSCRNVELVDFTGSNWWSAILPPPARYHHSRRCTVPEFLAWCQAPPWTNPYYRHPWPMPFD